MKRKVQLKHQVPSNVAASAKPMLPSAWAPLWMQHLREGLREDGFEWDFSGSAVGHSRKSRMRVGVLAKAAGVWVGEGLCVAVEQLSAEWGRGITARRVLVDGTLVKKGQLTCEWEGPVSSVLALERPFLNLACFAGGIATLTNQIVSVVRKACPVDTPRVTCTRKTLPGYRNLSVAAVVAGGGMPHRLGLDSGILLKENHIRAAGTLKAAVRAARIGAPHLLKVEVEVRNMDELKQALQAEVDVVMLDNFSPFEVEKAVRYLDECNGAKPLIEVSGGLGLNSIADYAIPGVSVLSVGALTHSVTALDLSMLEWALLKESGK